MPQKVNITCIHGLQMQGSTNVFEWGNVVIVLSTGIAVVDYVTSVSYVQELNLHPG